MRVRIDIATRDADWLNGGLSKIIRSKAEDHQLEILDNHNFATSSENYIVSRLPHRVIDRYTRSVKT